MTLRKAVNIVLAIVLALFIIGVVGTFGPTRTSSHIGPTTRSQVTQP